MRITAIFNLKGGVAKTTTAVNMAALLAAAHEKRVLVIDADSQCNTSEFLGRDLHVSDLDTLATALRDEADALSCIQHSNLANVDLLPASDELMELDLSAIDGKKVNVNCLRHLRKALSSLYDYVIIDCPPCFTAASAAALIAADDVLIPIKIDAFSLRGMANITRQISNMKKINGKLTVAGLLPVMKYKSSAINVALDTLKNSKYKVFTGIRRTPKVDDMTFAQKPLIVSSPTSSATVDYRRFVDEYIAGGEHDGV